MSGPEIGNALADQLDRLFTDASNLDASNAGVRDVSAKVWSQIQALELFDAAVPEEGGGFGLSWEDLYPSVSILGYHASIVPLADVLVANRLLAGAGLDRLNEPASLCGQVLRLEGQKLGGAGRPETSGRVVAVVREGTDDRICVASFAPGATQPDWNDAKLDAVSDVVSPCSSRGQVPAVAVLRSVQIAGALERVLALSTDYAAQRRQFGQPIANFQAVQHMLARLAIETAAAITAARTGLRLLDAQPELAAGIAKTRAALAADLGAAIAHQVHGAIGVTEEHELGTVTGLLRRWRIDGGSGHFWAESLGDMALDQADGQLWPWLIDQLSRNDASTTLSTNP